MGIFEPIWKTNEWKKKDKAVSAVFRMHNANKLNKVILTAPLLEVRCAAVGQLKGVSQKLLRLDKKTCLSTLLSINPDEIRKADYNWYIYELLKKLSDDEKYEVSKNATSCYVSHLAVECFGFNSDYLLRIINDEVVSIATKKCAIERISDEKILNDIAVNDRIIKEIRHIASQKLETIKESDRIHKELEQLKAKREACGRGGHKKKLIKYIPHGNGGKDAVYVCEKCGEEIIEPYEWSSADSI